MMHGRRNIKIITFVGVQIFLIDNMLLFDTEWHVGALFAG